MKNRIKSITHAFRGMRDLFRQEPNAKIHLLAAVLVVVVGIYFDISKMDWALVMIAIGMVLTAELFNTSIEELCNKVSPDYDPLIKKSKDFAAAGVLITALTAIIIGGIVFIPYFLKM